MTTQVDRRDFLRGAAAVTAVGAAAQDKARAADTNKTLVIASPATPQGLDLEYDASLGTIDIAGGFYDTPLAYKKIPDPTSPDVLREDTGVHPELPYGLALEGRLAEKWELAPDGKRVTFTMRQGVKSNWGNLLTAEDVRYSWERRFNSKGNGSFMASMLGTTFDHIKVESPQVVSFHFEKQTPLISACIATSPHRSLTRPKCGGWPRPTTPGLRISSRATAPALARINWSRSCAGSKPCSRPGTIIIVTSRFSIRW